jgi:hypothetical protein
LPFGVIEFKWLWPSKPLTIPEAMGGPKDAQRAARLAGLLHREAQLFKHRSDHPYPAAAMQTPSIGQGNRAVRDRLQRQPIQEPQVWMGDRRRRLRMVLRPQEAGALVQQEAMHRATAHPGDAPVQPAIRACIVA